MASAQVEIMSQVRGMADVITNLTIENIVQMQGEGRFHFKQEELEMLQTIIRNSADQGFSNVSASLIRAIDRRLK